MTLSLRWMVAPRASCYHAGDAVRRGLPLVDVNVADALAAPVGRLDALLAEWRLSVDEFWEVAPALAIGSQTPVALVEEFLRMGERGPEVANSAAEALASRAADLERAVFDLYPRLNEELVLRERPIREQWESRGPGMLQRMMQLAGGGFSLPAAEVALVQPCLGGGGETHLQFQLVRLEAVLTNSQPALPEPVRLGWLLFRLAVEREDLASGRATSARRRLISLAAVPLALEAAEHVEWSTCDAAALEIALDAWRLSCGAERSEIAKTLLGWFSETRRHALSWRQGLEDVSNRIAI
jgi:hypothetical protein